MKKLINKPDDVVREMLEGLALLAPDTVLLGEENVLIRRGPTVPAERPVALISGGGSGHEPAHGGYVGAGMLSAAVCGEVFTSPSTDAVLAAIRATAGPNGALLIVKNYTGDRLNFGLAAEIARTEGIPVEMQVVSDDVSLRGHVTRDHRRGIAGTVLIHKIAGAAAARGASLQEVAAVAAAATKRLGTMGVALDGCTLPGADKSGFALADDEIELGLGIHGERGVERRTPMAADSLAQTLVGTIVNELALQRGDRVALLVNGLGATPEMELAIVLRAAHANLAECGITVERAWAGTFLSAINMPGCSISLMKLDDELLALLDAPTQARAWPRSGRVSGEIRRSAAATMDTDMVAQAAVIDKAWIGQVQPALHAVAQALLANESHFAELDSVAGDGDLGASMKRAAQSILSIPATALGSPGETLSALSATLRKAIAGSSGPFYATALLRAGRTLAARSSPDARDWADAFHAAIEAVSQLGGAKAGDRTMLDALEPAANAFKAALEDGAQVSAAWSCAVDAADQGVKDTARMTPRVGRASYLGARAIGSPDAGAAAVAVWLHALAPYVK